MSIGSVGNRKQARAFAWNQQYKLYGNGDFYHVPKDRLEKNPLKVEKLSDGVKEIKAMLQKRIDSLGDADLQTAK